MAHVRPAAVAGIFYPGTRAALASEVREHLAGVILQTGDAPPAPKAIIVPHAGFVYSGPIAASAYARLASSRETIRRVVLFGPTHRVPVRALAVPSVEAFATPMGEVRIDRKAVTEALELPQVTTSDAAHAYEHSLEVQLPFLQAVLGDFSLVPFTVGSATPNEVSEVIDLLWGGAETLIVVSSDLSHYHRYAEARTTDRATGEAILAFSANLDHEQACGATPINGLLVAARRRGLAVELLDLRNSGDTAGDRNRVVGYASFAFVEPRANPDDGGERR
jgi:AmmeMemoRadiSam system protein B